MHGMIASKSLRQASIFLAAIALALPTVVGAHEEHRKDMSDADMAQMSMHDAPTAHGSDADMEPQPVAGGHSSAVGNMQVAQERTPADALQAAIAENRITSADDFLGRLHPIAAHFPIALLLIAGFAELLLLFRPALGLEPTIRFLVISGALGAVVAAVLGWLAAGWRLSDRSETLSLHRWNGTGIAAVALLATWLAVRAKSRIGLRSVLAVLAAALVVQGYLGGEMVFGPNHLGLR